MDSPSVQFFSLLQSEHSAELIVYLQRRGLLRNNAVCACGRPMNLQKFSDSPEGHCWRCTRCKKRQNIRTGSFFAGLKLPIRTILELLFHWMSDVPVTTAAGFAGVHSETAVQCYQWARDICSTKMVGLQRQLGGLNHTVEIDETLMFKRKNHVGHVVQQYWVFGMYDRELRKGYLMHVADRSAATLIPIIQQWIIPGSTIESDEWGAYAQLAALGFVHRTVNHRHNFVNPETGATTNHVESFWSRMKKRMKRVTGSVGVMKWSHLDEAVYREWYDMKAGTVWANWDSFLQHISEIYPF